MKTIPAPRNQAKLPDAWKNKVIAKSRSGPLGHIRVRRFTGVENNSAARTIQQFEKNMEGNKEYIATLLEAHPSLNQAEKALVALLRDPKKGKSSLARLIAESKAEPAKVISKASHGALLLGQAEAYIEIGVAMPQVVRELRRHIQPKNEICVACQGKGKVPKSVQETKETLVCPVCKGDGGLLTTSDEMEFAVEKLIELSKMGKQPAGPAVQIQNIDANIEGPQISLVERVVTATHTMLFKKAPEALPEPPQDLIEAEVVSSPSSIPESS